MRSSAELLHIEDFLDRYSSQLSGGQRQRVAVARAIATKADVLLMDEPLSNLDALLRLEMRAELKTLLQSLDATTIYVTHDQIEALSMGDRIAVMNQGRIVQLGNPLEVYDNPADTFVGGFIGTPPMNFLEAQVSSNGGTAMVEVSGGSFEFPSEVAALAGHDLLLGIRAESIGVETAAGEGLVRAKVIVLEPLGSHNLLTVRCGDDTLKVSVNANLFPLADSDVWLRLEPARIRWMDRDTGTAIVSGAEELATETAVVITYRKRLEPAATTTVRSSEGDRRPVLPLDGRHLLPRRRRSDSRALVEVVWGRDDPMPLDDFVAALPEAFAVVSAGWRYGDVLDRAPRLEAILTVSGGWPPELDYAGCFRAWGPRALGRSGFRRGRRRDGARARARVEP